MTKLRSSKVPALKTKTDVVLLYGPTEDGQGNKVLRAREDRVELGEVRPLKEGQAIHGEVVRLKPREESAALFDVETSVAATATADDAITGPALAAPSGPRQVANPQYRKGWERVFSGSKTNEAKSPNRNLN